MAVSSVFIILMLVLAAVFVVVFILAYNRRLDRVASGKERDTHSSLPEPRETAGAVSRIVLLVLAVVIFFSVSAMSGTVSSLNSQISSLRSAQNDLRREIRELKQLLEERDRLTASSDWKIVDRDMQAKTATIGCSFTLKQYSESTAAALTLGDRTVPLTGDGGGVFRGEFTVGLFEKLEEPTLRVVDDGAAVTESTDLPEYVFRELLRGWFAEQGGDRLEILLAPWQTEEARALSAFAESAWVTDCANWRIFRWDRVTESLLKLRAADVRLPEGGFTLEIAGWGGLRLEVSDSGTTCERTNAAPDVRLSTHTAAQLLFGPMPFFLLTQLPERIQPLAASWFPLPLCWLRQNYV